MYTWLCAWSLAAGSPSSLLSMGFCGCKCASSNNIVLFLHSPFGYSTSVIALSQLSTVFCNCLFCQAPNLPIFDFCFLSFLSCLSSIPGEFVLLSWAKGIQRHLPLLNKRFCSALSRSHVFAQLFCFVITMATRNNIVKWYLHEKAIAFLICFRGVQGGGGRLFCSSLTPFSSLHAKCLGTL